MGVLAIVLMIAGFAGMIWVVVESFSEDTLQGVLCLFVPCYAFYFAIAHVGGGRKWIMIGLMVCGVLGRVLLFAAE